MTLSEDLLWRGLIKDKTFPNEAWLDKPGAFYLGIDASAISLTVGNLAILMLVRRLASSGWKAYLVMGGGTSLIGDPGGKNEERTLMSRETVVNNITAIQNQVTNLLADEKYTLVDNYDWLSTLKYVDFLREVGKHFSMTELMQRDFVVERMGKGGTGISYAEFSYSLVQGYDFWHLFSKHGVNLQVGGSDQWGNLLSGVSLIRKKEGKEAHAMSMPLVINKVTGQKFGKSEDGAVWLDEKLTSVYKFYQFWLNADDDGVEEYLRIYTFLSKEEIEKIMAEFKSRPGERLAQKSLAYEVTKIVHGASRADSVKHATEVLFGQANLDEAALDVLHHELPVVKSREGLLATIVRAGLASSNTEATRFISEGAISINGEKATVDSVFKKGRNLIKRGKNTFAIVDA